MSRTQPTPTPLDRLRWRRARAAQIRRRRSTACMSVTPRKRSAPGGLPPLPLDPRRSALASRRARRQASAAPQVRARRPQSSRPATAGLPTAHHRRRRSTVSALRSASPVRPALRRAPGARLVHPPVLPLTARHVTRPAIAGRLTASLQFRQRHRSRGRAAKCGRTASASLQPCPATAPARPLCARPRGGARSPALVEGVAVILVVGARGLMPSSGVGAMGGDVVRLGVAGGGTRCTAGEPWALPTPAPVAGGSGAGG